MHKFDYSFLNNGLLPTQFEKIAKIQSVKSSNEIEGVVTTDERIVQIVQQNSAPLNHNEEEISGYRDALNIIHSGYQNIQFNKNTVLSLHRTMLSASDYDFAGQYKNDDNVILEIDSFGKGLGSVISLLAGIALAYFGSKTPKNDDKVAAKTN